MCDKLDNYFQKKLGREVLIILLGLPCVFSDDKISCYSLIKRLEAFYPQKYEDIRKQDNSIHNGLGNGSAR